MGRDQASPLRTEAVAQDDASGDEASDQLVSISTATNATRRSPRWSRLNPKMK